VASSLTLALQAWALGMRAVGEYSAICKQLQLRKMASDLHDEGLLTRGTAGWIAESVPPSFTALRSALGRVLLLSWVGPRTGQHTPEQVGPRALAQPRGALY
jgi:hypothetical protein